MKDKRATLSLVVAVVAALLLWWAGSGGTAQEPPAETAAPASSTDSGGASHGTDPRGGLARVAVADLPAEARDTLEAIDAGGPYRYEQDGATFGNFEELLPDQPRGYYTEHTVETPGSDDRGARRIVVGDGGDFYYTADHYASFRRIDR